MRLALFIIGYFAFALAAPLLTICLAALYSFVFNATELLSGDQVAAASIGTMILCTVGSVFLHAAYAQD